MIDVFEVHLRRIARIKCVGGGPGVRAIAERPWEALPRGASNHRTTPDKQGREPATDKPSR